MNTPNNQRYREMERRLNVVFLQLLEEKPFEEISVKMICEQAGVNRSTFYAHYKDIEEMIDSMESKLNQELKERYARQDWEQFSLFNPDCLMPFLQHIQDHQYFYRCAMRWRKTLPLKKEEEEFRNRIVHPLCEQAGITDIDEIEYDYLYFRAGFTIVLARWIEKGCLESKEKMAEILIRCMPYAWQKQ